MDVSIGVYYGWKGRLFICLLKLSFLPSHTHTHTHTHIYIHIHTQGIGDPPSEMQSVKHNGSSNSSRHSTGGTIRVSTNGTPSGRKTTADQGPDSHSTTTAATREGCSKRSKKYSSLQV